MTLQTRLDDINDRINQETERGHALQQQQQQINQALVQCREALLQLNGAKTILLELLQEQEGPSGVNGAGSVLTQNADLLAEARNA